MLTSRRSGRIHLGSSSVSDALPPVLSRGAVVRKRLRSIALISAVFAGLFGGSAPAEDAYFYANGKKQALKVSQEWVAARADDSTTGEGLNEQPAFDARRRAGRVNREVLVAPVREGASPADRQNLERTLNKKRGVSRSLRVYEGKRGAAVIETGDILVRFRPEVSRAQAEAILAEHGAEILRPLGKFAPNGYAARVTDPERNANDVANAIYERGVAVFSHADFLVSGQPNSTPNDPFILDQWYLNNPGSTNPARKAGADIKAVDAWRLTRGSGVTVAVLDDGFDLSHEEFQGKISYSYDYYNNDQDASPNAHDFHGTPCAGLIAATANNAKGIAGVAHECSLILMKVGEVQAPGQPAAGKTLFNIGLLAQAFMDAADRGAHVISCSWELGHFPAVEDAIKYAATSGRGGRGSVIFFSSGNDSGLISNPYAMMPEVIAVGAATALDVRADYSNYGPELDLVAPSAGAKPEGELDVVTTDVTGAAGLVDGDYVYFGGTSAACPIAAGVGALVLANEPSLTRTQVYQRLTSTADKIDTQNGGYDPNGFSQQYGYGRVNAIRAVAASDTTPPILGFSSPQDTLVSRDLPEEISGYAYDYQTYLQPSVELVIYQDGQFWNGSAWVDQPAGTPIPVALPKPQVQENGSWSYTNLPTGADVRSGVYHINASVYDAAGNPNLPEPGTTSRSFRIDRKPPTVTIGSPANGAILTDVPKTGWLHGNASDEGSPEPPEVQVYIQRVSDGQYWAGGSWVDGRFFAHLGFEYTEGDAWNCTGPLPGIGPDSSRCMAAGDYDLIVVAKDEAGNEAEVKSRFSVEHTLTLPNPSFLAAHTEMLVPDTSVTAEGKLTYPPLEHRTNRDQTPAFLRVDGAGNYITGMSMYERIRDFVSHPSAAIHKHNAAGQQLWRLEHQQQKTTVTLEGEEHSRYYERFADDHEWQEISEFLYGALYSIGAMELDAEGNVYVALNVHKLEYRKYATSSSGGDLFEFLAIPVNLTLAVKFDSNGSLVWRRTLGADGVETFWHPTSSAVAIKPLADGSAALLIDNSYRVQGSSFSPWYSFTQSVVARVGAQSGGFKKHFGFSENNSTPLGMEVDAQGNLYLVTSDTPQLAAHGYQIPGGDHVIRKISPTGELLREVRIEHCDMPEIWTDFAVEPATGHLYIAGNHTISYENTGRQVAMKFDLSLAEGEELLWRTFGPANGVSGGYPVHLALSANGVSLGSNCSLSFPNNTTYFTVSRIALDGSLTWSRKYSTPGYFPGSYGDTLDGLTADESGNLYILGFMPGEGGLNEGVMRKISALGDVQFSKPFPANTYSGANNPDIVLIPNRAAPSAIAVFADSPEPGDILLFSNPGIVYPPITIPEDKPADIVAGIGADAKLTVNASGSAPLAYQWRRHMGDTVQDIPGANAATLTISNVGFADSGEYSVVVSNNVAASVVSRAATLTVEATVPLEQALDGAGFTWTTGGDGAWRGQTSVSYDGASSAVSGATPNNGSSWMETTVTGPGTLTFRWKVSSQFGFDFLRVYLDGAEQASISGSEGWLQHSLSIPEGTHTIRWAYTKDNSVSNGDDRGWVDDVSFVSSTADLPVIKTQPFDAFASIGSDVSFAVIAEGTGVLTYQWFKDGEEIPFATEATLSVSAITFENAGSYRVRVTAPGGSVLSDVATLMLVGDVVPPTVAITTPTAAATKVTTPEFTVSGTASDNEGVASVYVYVDRGGGSYTEYPATGTTNWSAQVTLGAGVNHILAYSIDTAGNYSGYVSRTVTLDVPVTLSISSTDGGKVFEKVGKKQKTAPATSQRNVGKKVKLQAKPLNGFIFAGWSVGDDSTIAIPAASFTLEVTSNLALTARFIPTPFPALAGTYSGIIEGSTGSAATSGGFTFTVTSAGKVTSKLNYGGKQIPVKLSLDATTSLNGKLKGPGSSFIDFSVQFTSAGVTGIMTQGSSTLAEFTGAKVLAFSKQNRPSIEGRYTLLLDDPEESGAGQAAVQVTKTGKVKIIGALAGGDAFTANAPLCEGNRLPVYTQSKAGQTLVGWMNFDAIPDVTDLQGTLTQFSSPLAPGVELTASGSAHVATAGSWLLEGLEAAGGVAKLTFSGGGLAASLEQQVTLAKVVSKKGKLKVAVTLPNPNGNGLKLTFDPTTGAFGGLFKPTPGSLPVPFAGVLLQNQDLGEGQFKNGAEAGTVTLLPVPPAVP